MLGRESDALLDNNVETDPHNDRVCIQWLRHSGARVVVWLFGSLFLDNWHVEYHA
jgi:hypothetical protein